MNEPPDKRVSFFVDGQNLFRSVKRAFGYEHPNYDIKKLASSICRKQGWKDPVSISFYTGIHKDEVSPKWNKFWRRKKDAMETEGISVFVHTLSYSSKKGKKGGFPQAREKGIDVRIAIDVMKALFENTCDVVVIFSQDQDFSELVKEVRDISRSQNRWIKIASAYPVSSKSKGIGITRTDWIKINKEMYDNCIDFKNYMT